MCGKVHSLYRILQMLFPLWSMQGPSEEALVELVSVRIIEIKAQFCYFKVLRPWAHHHFIILVLYWLICASGWQAGSFFVELYDDDLM